MTDESEADADPGGRDDAAAPGSRGGDGAGVDRSEPADGEGTATTSAERDASDAASDRETDSATGRETDAETDRASGAETERAPDQPTEHRTSDAGTDRTADAGAGGSDAALVDDEVLDPTEIDAAELTLPERSLHPRIRLLWALRAVVVALVAGALAAVATTVFDLPVYVPAGVVVVFLALGVPFALLRYRIWRYAVREDALYLERGVVTRVRTVVPLVRIQHVDTRRGPVERLAGLATVVVFTAGSRGADVAIPGVSASRAEDLQRRLKRLAIASEADTSV